MRILHVTRHLGGGLGTVILDWAAYSKNGHTIACLDYANDKAKRVCKEKAIFLSANLADYRIKRKQSPPDQTTLPDWR